jgi:CRISPR-associated endonuclease/helicase Cas3
VTPLAHSAKPKQGIGIQTYADHVSGVVSRAIAAAHTAARYSSVNADVLTDVVRSAGEFHDLGKLDPDNQEVLAGKKKAECLPVQHTDAGTAYLMNENKAPAAALVRSHHIGLPDFVEEGNKKDSSVFRDEKVAAHVDQTLAFLLDAHRNSGCVLPSIEAPDTGLNGDASIFFRIALSCLADGDHTDTAVHYGGYPTDEKHIDLRAAERLASLDRYVSGLIIDDDRRSRQRTEMYYACRNAKIKTGISSCDSPVGTGKTTAVMSHLLSQADSRGLRRIIVVLPFTNIITQSVAVYRKALVLPGENPEDVVAELHHRADFQDLSSRHLSALWKAPIIVTTAVSFFETLSSNRPSTLRRLHNLPGSAVFVDESHAALPAKLLPLAWHWIKGFANEWGCYWVLASGSLNRFWKIPEFDDKPPEIPEIISDKLRGDLSRYETKRVSYRYREECLDEESLVEFVRDLPGPRIVICNTVQSAAAAAESYRRKFGRQSVEHLSTALTPNDRSETLDRVKSRLVELNDIDWALFATSCVEAGVDISFRTGIREIGSLVSLLQTAGRVNRQGVFDNAEVWTVRLAENGLFKIHPGLKDAAKVFKEYCDAEILIGPELCTEALKREVRLSGNMTTVLKENEQKMRFPIIDKEFQVIASDTRMSVVEDSLVQKIERYEKVDWLTLQRGSVQIWGYKLEALCIPEFERLPGIYKWNLGYDSFLGYMAGLLKVEAFVSGRSGMTIL